MTYFQSFILDFFSGIPEVNISLPSFFESFLADLVKLMNCFIIFNDFSTLLATSVTYAFINVAFAFTTFISDLKSNSVR